MMQSSWMIKKLSDLCEINIGKTPERGDERNWDKKKQTNNVWLSIADLNNSERGYVSESAEYISDYSLSKMKIVKADTLLMSFKLTIGRCAIAKRDLYTNEAIAALPIKTAELNIFYLKYYLEAFNWDELLEGDVKVKGKTLNKEKLKEIPILFPSLAIQERIVSLLDEKFAQIDKLKENAEKNLQNARELFQSKINSIFSDPSFPKKNLGSCGAFKNGMNFSSSDSGYSIFSLGVGDFKDNFEIRDTSQLSKISLLGEPSEDYLLRDGDIIFVRSNGNKELVGRCLIAYPGKIKTTYSGFCIRFRKTDSSIDSEFLVHFMKTDSSRKILNGKEGANISNLNQKILSSFEIPVPSIAKQKEIVLELNHLYNQEKKLEEIYNKQVKDCEELKQSLLNKAFSGEL